MVVGSLQQERWTGKDGKNQSRLKVLADRVQFLDRRIEVPVPLPAGPGTDDPPQNMEGGVKDAAGDDAAGGQGLFEE